MQQNPQIIKLLLNKNSNQTDELDLILAAFTGPVLIYDKQGAIVRINQAVHDVLCLQQTTPGKYELPAGSAASIQALLVPAEGSIVAKALQGETTRDAIYQLSDSTGMQRLFTCSAAPINHQETTVGAILYWQDITARMTREQLLETSNRNLQTLVTESNARQKLADKQIKNNQEAIDIKNTQIMVSNKLLEIIFSNTHFLIAYLDTNFTFIQVNDAYARAFNQEPAFFTDKNHFALFPHTENQAIFTKVVKTGNSYITYSDPFFHSGQPEPGLTYWDWSLQPIKNQQTVEGIILVLIDVTRRKKAEDDLLNAKRLSDIGTLAATVAHELRNPLGVIRAAIYNIRDKRQNPGIDVHLENIDAKIEESDQIINNLLSYSKFNLPELSGIMLYEFLNELFDDILSKNLSHKIVFIRNYDTLKQLTILIDPVQIREVLNNLVNNAYQALPQTGGRIEVLGCLTKSHQLQLQISDNGDGIATADLERIFDPFFSKRSRGTGLGLTISKELIKLHNGSLKIHSTAGHGTTVIITLPLP